LERLVDAIITPWHNRHLNDIAPFTGELNPSAENVALHIARSLSLPTGVTLVTVEVWETSTNRATYIPEQIIDLPIVLPAPLDSH
jgi:6-pyruvoyl-tetrahydropterin synthase